MARASTDITKYYAWIVFALHLIVALVDKDVVGLTIQPPDPTIDWNYFWQMISVELIRENLWAHPPRPQHLEGRLIPALK